MQEGRGPIIIIANQASQELAGKVASLMGLELSAMCIREFADGEIYHTFPRSLRASKIGRASCRERV